MRKAYRAHVLKHLEKLTKRKFNDYNGPVEGLSLRLLVGDAPYWFGSSAGGILKA